MIQRETARNGQAIFKVDGLSIVSSFDPSKEAKTWAEKTLEEIGDHDSLIVIGAACGYHLRELARLKPSLSILTIENSQEIKTAALEIQAAHPDGPLMFEILAAENGMQMTESLLLRDFLSRRFAVAIHPGQAQMRVAWTSAVSRFLTGRDPLSFLLQLRMRPELFAHFDETKIKSIGDSEGPISILTIRQLFKLTPDATASRERRLWRVLEELIV